jgi:hypothetical protein
MAGRKPKNPPSPRDVAAIADRLHSAAIHVLRRVRKQDAAAGEGPARLLGVVSAGWGSDDAGASLAALSR